MAITDRLSSMFRRTPVPPTQTAGVHGVVVHGGYIVSEERNPTLVGLERYRTFSDILANTSIVAAGTRYFLNLVSKAGWKVEPANESPQAVELALLLKHMMQDMATPWHRVVRRASMYRYYGFSIQEWTAKRRPDGAIGMQDVAPRAQRTIERWDVEDNGKVHGVVQRSPQTGVEIYLPRGKVLYMVDDTLDDSPEGMGIFRHLAEPAARLRRYELLEAYGYETDLKGVPVGRAPLSTMQDKIEGGDLSAEQRDATIEPLKTFIEKHIKNPELGLLLDSLPYSTEDEKGAPSNVMQWGLELLKGGNHESSVAVSKAIERLNRELARIMGVEHLLLGGDGKGSLALSRDKTQSFGLIVDSTLTELAESFEKDYVGPIWQLNGWPDELKPRLKPDATQYRDIEQVTGALMDMANSGAVLSPDDPAIDEVRDLLGLSHQPVVDITTDASLLEDTTGETDDE